MKKVIVTGANGFVGSAVCAELSLAGVEVIAVVRCPEENIDNIADCNGIRIIYCDFSNFRNLASLIPDRDVDVLFHFAWVGSAGILRSDLDVQINNIKYSCDTVRACAEIGCKRIIFASSIMEFEIEAVMATEITPGINTLYSSAKLAADYLARTLAGDLGIDYIRAVISNIYGPGEISSRLIVSSLKKMISGERCSYSPGDQLYDFIYISDAAKAFVAIANMGLPNKTYYIGSLAPKPLKEFLIEMRDSFDPSIEIGLGDIPFNGISLTYKEFDVESVKKDTGFVPMVSFDEGIKNTIEWLRGNS